MLGGSLQLITMGWANVGAAMAPDASLAAVASTIILILGGQGAKGIGPAIALAVPLAVAGLALTMFVRTASNIMDSRAEDADIAGIERWHFIGIGMEPQEAEWLTQDDNLAGVALHYGPALSLSSCS